MMMPPSYDYDYYGYDMGSALIRFLAAIEPLLMQQRMGSSGASSRTTHHVMHHPMIIHHPMLVQNATQNSSAVAPREVPHEVPRVSEVSTSGESSQEQPTEVSQPNQKFGQGQNVEVSPNQSGQRDGKRQAPSDTISYRTLG